MGYVSFREGIDIFGMSKHNSLRGVNECRNIFGGCTHVVSGRFVAKGDSEPHT